MGISIVGWTESRSYVMKFSEHSPQKIRGIQRNKATQHRFLGERVLRFPIYQGVPLEDDAHHKADTPARNCRVVNVGEASHIVHVNKFEDIVDTERGFYVGNSRIHSIAGGLECTILEFSWEDEYIVAVAVLFQIRIVFVCEASPEHIHPDVLANLQTIDEWNTVENLAVQVPVEHQLRIAVVEKLHVVDEVIHIVFVNVG